jgi:hypothetical protein
MNKKGFRGLGVEGFKGKTQKKREDERWKKENKSNDK